ncbi:hypothetical protein [Clostridioides difficile]|jgi:hypothetical protein|uniref:hypothetical protein n=1 Tax=Clostridioides difficile TaxID=1496 RepID=UPI00044CCCB8|nr:hypothetical protein [Clostridioides difficile]OFU44003.1 hypothetical protein HMPREF3071_11690 [Clostridium sp. HMSC19A11]QIW86791.1 hypothetical protein JD033_12 [Clostridioides phage JD033]EGT4563279.1 hypothetical protein [Clostridioides difficile]EGT4720532.1 hypothetical protein [Clostridioides difficile]EIS9401957.1 hypothetical protein [Clostridioides difficile]
MKIGKYLIIPQEQEEARIEDLKNEVRKRDDRIEFLVYVGNKNRELIKNLEEQLKGYKSELDVYSLFIDCILNKETRKAIAIYNRTKSIRIKQKSLNSISKKIEKIKQVTSL